MWSVLETSLELLYTEIESGTCGPAVLSWQQQAVEKLATGIVDHTTQLQGMIESSSPESNTTRISCRRVNIRWNAQHVRSSILIRSCTDFGWRSFDRNVEDLQQCLMGQPRREI